MRGTHLLVVNYAMDENSQVFSHQINVVNKLAQHFDQITVLTGNIGKLNVPDNVQVISYDWAEGKRFTSLTRFLRNFLILVFKFRFSSVFSHMTSVQSAFISPITKILRLRHYLWYAHTSDNNYLRIAKILTDGIITSTPGSCPAKGRNVFPIGQAVDSHIFKNLKSIKLPLTEIIHIGRLDPSKKIESIVLVVKNARIPFASLALKIIGSPSSERYKDYAVDLKNRFKFEVNEGWLEFIPSIQRSQIPATLREESCFIHAFEGSLDKTLIEATLSGIPVATINKEYIEIFGSWTSLNPSKLLNLEDEFDALLLLDQTSLENEISRRYKIAIDNHDLDGWITRLIGILDS